MDNEERFALADRITELEGKLAEALLSAERAREERNREHVRLNAGWMEKCEELRKERDHYQMAAEAEAKFADEFREKAEELLADAMRYRWLRDNCFDSTEPGDGDAFWHTELHFESDELECFDTASLDNAIDAAILAATKEPKA